VLKLLYVTPERVAGGDRLVQLLRRLDAAGMLARFVIDEVNCRTCTSV
jgi:ATP-dependent DNA helicase Q1